MSKASAVELQPGQTWRAFFHSEADRRLRHCAPYKELVELLVDGDRGVRVSALIDELGLSPEESGPLMRGAAGWRVSSERAKRFPELNAMWESLDKRVQAVATKLRTSILSDEDRDALERELQGLRAEQDSQRPAWTAAKLAVEMLPGLAAALGLEG